MSHATWSRAAVAIVASAISLPTSAGRLPPLSAEPLPQQGPQPPWRPRRAKVRPTTPKHQALVDLAQWRAEPETPAHVDETHFAIALSKLCQQLKRRRAKRIARWMVELGEEFAVDPFLTAALSYIRSGCRSRLRSAHGVGLTMINRPMHARFIRDGHYRYWTLETEEQEKPPAEQDGGQLLRRHAYLARPRPLEAATALVTPPRRWLQQQLKIDRYPFYPATLRRAKVNVYFASALLRIAQDQCPAADQWFRSVPHRHAVSHFIWGDRVMDAGHEDLVLRARRRLLAYYHAESPAKCGTFEGISVYSPLDGTPRKVLSGMGDVRDRGRRRHKGIDLFARVGTPVYAVADGEVIFSGASIRRRRRRPRPKNMSFKVARRIRRRRLGTGGLYVMLRHSRNFVSGYFHLSRYRVRRGQRVRAGDLIGKVGRTGIRHSAPHLHLEFRKRRRRHFNPLKGLASCVIAPRHTYLGRWRQARRKWRRRRRWRRQARSAARQRLSNQGT